MRLAAILVLQSWRPAWLHATAQQTAVDQVAHTLITRGDEAGHERTAKPPRSDLERDPAGTASAVPSAGQVTETGAALRRDAASGATDDEPRERPVAREEPTIGSPRARPSPDRATQSPQPQWVRDHVSTSAAEPTPTLEAAPVPTEATPRESSQPESWVTHCGGVFYLINVLNTSAAQSILCSDRAALAFPSGWAWLHHFGVACGALPDETLLEFLTRAAELNHVRELQALPPLPRVEELLGLARARYEASGIWSPELFDVPARVARVDQFVDVHYAMADLRLDVRRSGLDVDPGFVPWLGSVVRFHYGADPSSGTRFNHEPRRTS